MEAPATGRILGQPVLMLSYSVPLAGSGLYCDSNERWVLFDNGQILFCDTLLTRRKQGSYRVAQLKKKDLDRFLASLPREQFLSEKSMETLDATDLPSTSLWLRNGQTWKYVRVGGFPHGPEPKLMDRAIRWVLRAGGRWRSPPPAFAAIDERIRSVPLDASVPLEGRVPAVSESPLDWSPKHRAFPADMPRSDQ